MLFVNFLLTNIITCVIIFLSTNIKFLTGGTKTMNQEKMIKTAKVLDTVFRIARKVALIALIVLVVAVTAITIVHFINPDAVIGTGFASLEVGSVTFEMMPETTPTNRQILVLTWIISLFAVGCGAILYDILRQAGKILEPMKEGNPFHPSVSANIRRIGILILILDLVQQITDFVHIPLHLIG